MAQCRTLNRFRIHLATSLDGDEDGFSVYLPNDGGDVRIRWDSRGVVTLTHTRQRRSLLRFSCMADELTTELAEAIARRLLRNEFPRAAVCSPRVHRLYGYKRTKVHLW